MINDYYLDAEMESWERATDNDFDKALKEIYQEAYGEAPDPNCIMRLHSKTDKSVIRIDAAIRLRWVCASVHDHRFRLTALLCSLLKGVE
jgi:RNase P/RNase MRP subunit POP5